MMDVSIFNIGGQSISVKDAEARTLANTANQNANGAKTESAAALQKIKEIENLSRVEISYSKETETITITTGNHGGV